MATVASLWIGDRLGMIEQASIRSFLKVGDHFILYAYNPIAGVPDGVEMRDAQEIYPCHNIIRHRKSGSPALHSDLFRYALLAKTDCIWVDLDMIALRSFDFPSEWVFGIETEGEVNGAVLNMPKNSKALQELLKFNERMVGFPPMMKGWQRVRYWFKSWGREMTIDRWPWGSIGPRALSHYLHLHDEFKYAMPVSAFYAIPLQRAHEFAIPGKLMLDDLPKDAWGVHLWGKELRQYLKENGMETAPEGSFLHSFIAG
ncbi:MAG: hypothetical protein WAS93_07430 [Burkholderiaceae bacterium]